MTRQQPLVVYDASTWSGSLAAALFSRAHVIDGHPQDSARDILSRLPANAGTFLFHLDYSLTNRFPPDRGQLIRGLRQHGIRVINARATDITKSALHRAIERAQLPMTRATRSGAASERLIVKTDLNYGGWSERYLSTSARQALGIPLPSRRILGPASYRLYRRSRAPGWIWRDRSVVVERYVGDAEGRWWRVLLCGGHKVLLRLQSRSRIKKLDNSTVQGVYLIGRRRCCVQDVAIIAMVTERLAAEIHVEYGAIDIMVGVDDRPFVIDVNSTPYVSSEHLGPSMIRHLRTGWTSL